MSHPKFRVPTEQSRKETCDTEEISKDRRGQQQQEREDELRSEAHAKSTVSKELLSAADIPSAELYVKYLFEAFTQDPSTLLNRLDSRLPATLKDLLESFTQIPSTLLNRSHSRLLATLKDLCPLAGLCTFISLLVAAAAYENTVVVTGSETMPTVTVLLMPASYGAILSMAAAFILTVHDDVQGNSRILRDNIRGCPEKCWYVG